MVSEHEDRGVEGWLIAPPSLPLVVWPWASLRTEFVTPHDLCADVVAEVASEVVVQPAGTAWFGSVGPASCGSCLGEELVGVGMAEGAL